MGDKHLRKLLVIGATALVRCKEQARNRSFPPDQSTGQRARAGGESRDSQQNGANRMGGDDARRNL